MKMKKLKLSLAVAAAITSSTAFAASDWMLTPRIALEAAAAAQAALLPTSLGISSSIVSQTSTLGNSIQGAELLVGAASVTVDALTDADVLLGATGNINLNMAAGSYNAQQNSTALAANGGAVPLVGTVIIAQAQSSSKQAANLNVASASGDFDAGLGLNFADGATGNVAVNTAAGFGNVQANQLSLAAVGDAALAIATSNHSQTSWLNGSGFIGDGGAANMKATLSTGALDGATGNIAVNIAAGNGNLQGNALSATSGL